MLELVLYPDDRLKQKCQPVRVFDAKLRNTIREMVSSMKQWGGIGLAAPQCGILQRMFVASVPGRGTLAFINPQLKVLDWTPSTYDEGCLSIPDARISVARPAIVKVKAYNELGKPFDLTCTGLLSVCVQHEYDHLDGVLMMDHKL